jgi:hypothetical protein
MNFVSNTMPIRCRCEESEGLSSLRFEFYNEREQSVAARAKLFLSKSFGVGSIVEGTFLLVQLRVNIIGYGRVVKLKFTWVRYNIHKRRDFA